MNISTKRSALGAIVSSFLLIGVSFAGVLSPAIQTRIDTAAIVIVDYLEKRNVSPAQFAELLEPYKLQFANNEQKLSVVDALEQATADKYYKVDDFLACTSYYDGCNECVKQSGEYTMACTLRACIHQDKPACNSYDEVPDLPQIINDPADKCLYKGGQRIAEHAECENISEAICNQRGGEYNACGSACRHEEQPAICTKQCVPYCDMTKVTDPEVIHASTQKALDTAQALWQEQELSDYTAVQKIVCFCPQEYVRPVEYHVVGGMADTGSAYYADDEGGMVGTNPTPQFETVPSLFAIIQDAIDQNAETITVEYDDDMGYPQSIWIDMSYMIADEERSISYTVYPN